MCPPPKENGFLPDYRRPARSDAGAAWPRSISARPPIPKARWPTTPIGKSCSRWPSVMTSWCWRMNVMPISISTTRRSARCPRGWPQSGGFTRLLTFHSLSKRSGLPGLRSGMVAGDADLIEKFRAFRNVAGPTVPTPAAGGLGGGLARRSPCRRQPRRLSPRRWRRPKRILGNRMRRPEGGFFLWLEVGNGEESALRLWREQGVRVLPGAYMGREIAARKNPVKPWLFLCPGGPC